MNHGLPESTYFKIHVEQTEEDLNSVNKYQTIWQYHNVQSPASSISLLSKRFVNIIFYRGKNNKLQRPDI